MADEAKKLKNIRKIKLAIFTRKRNSLQNLIEGESTVERLQESIAEVRSAMRSLEQAHEDYAGVIEEAELDAEGDFLLIPSASLDSIETNFANRTKVLNQADKHSSARLRLEHGVVSFGSPSKKLEELCAAKEISLSDMERELDKIETSFETLKVEIMELDPSADHAELLGKYQTQVVEEVDRCKKLAYKYRNQSSSESTPPSVTTPVDGGARPSNGFSSTKRETVMLPTFSGEEKTAYLQYPIWKTQWDSHITEYETKYRATMLLNHLDAKAKEQIVGLENDYPKAIEQLEKYYNDAKKIVRACLDEVRAHSNVSPHDYKALVSYRKCLVNNYTRLTACGLGHEMSNTAALGVIVRKLPINEAVEWQRYLSKQSRDKQAKPFPSFMDWLKEAGESWDLMAASGTGTKGKSGATQVHHTFFGDTEDTDVSKQDKPCFKCGEKGHWKRDCKKGSPKNSNGGYKQTGGGKSLGARGQKDRAPPRNKKYHCAFHKGLPGRACSSWSCAALKYSPVDERLKLLRENGDCESCCGDCPRNDCQSRNKRTCGGGKEGRGCGADHLGHELFCRNAKLVFSTQIETVLRAQNDSDESVLLQVMKIPSLSPELQHETVLWDSASTGYLSGMTTQNSWGFHTKRKN